MDLTINNQDLQKLLGAASGDAALLYLYLCSGGEPNAAGKTLNMQPSRLSLAGATLRQLGLWQPESARTIPMGERPSYSEEDVTRAMDRDREFKDIYGEVQRALGKNLNTEELKILLGFVRYLGLGPDVISVLVSYCKDRARRRGSNRNPSLRTIEKEAYAWAEQGIDSIQEAAAFIQRQNVRNSQMNRLMGVLQIHGRQLTAPEVRYAQQWLDWGFDMEALAMAYERTCLNTGGLNWAYMHKILIRWQQAGLLTAERIRGGDTKPGSKPQPGQRQLDADEQAAIARMLQEV